MSNSSQNFETKLWMITSTPSSDSSEGEKAGGGYTGGIIGGDEPVTETEDTSKVSLSTRQLQENLNQFLVIIGDLFTQAEQQAKQASSERKAKPGIELDQIELSAAVNAEGEVGFWGLAKGKVGGVTEIKLTFKRKES